MNEAFARFVDDTTPPPGAGGAAAALVNSLVVADTDLPQLRGFDGRVSVVVTGGAGQLTGPVALCERLGLELAGAEVAVRDPDDAVGNVRRFAAAASLDVPLYVELPETGSWPAAADEVAAHGFRLKLRTADASRVDAALDRETPFKCAAGVDPLPLLGATAVLWDGGTAADAAEVLEGRAAVPDDLTGARRWFTSWHGDPVALLELLR